MKNKGVLGLRGYNDLVHQIKRGNYKVVRVWNVGTGNRHTDFTVCGVKFSFMQSLHGPSSLHSDEVDFGFDRSCLIFPVRAERAAKKAGMIKKLKVRSSNKVRLNCE